MFLMSGLSGSGKSTVARQLARKIGAIHLRSDAVRKHLAGIPLHEKGGNDLYTEEMNQKTYARLLELGITLASQGYSVILDAKYDRKIFRHEAEVQAANHNLPLQILYCTAPEEVLRDRLLSRTGDVSDATVDLLSSQKAAIEPFSEAELCFVKTIHTNHNLEAQLNI